VPDKTRVVPLAATLMVIAVNAAANIVPINGFNTGQLSDLYPTGLTPAGWVFSIWSLIYLGLLAFSVAAWRSSGLVGERAAVVAGPYLVNAVANASWIFAWHYRLVPLSFAIMLVILGTLVVIFRRLRARPTTSRAATWLVDAPFSLYFGWITAATILNFGALLYDLQRYPLGLGMDGWALVSIAVALATYVWMAATTRDVIYSGVFVWAAIGIASRSVGVTEEVRIVAATGAAAVLACLGWVLIRRRPQAAWVP
jgi:TspO/MBR family